MEILFDDDVHHRQRQCYVSARINWQMPIRAPCGAGSVRVDHYQLRALVAGFFNERPQMNVGCVNVRGPRNNVLGMPELLRVGADVYAVNRFHSGGAGLGTNVAVQL